MSETALITELHDHNVTGGQGAVLLGLQAPETHVDATLWLSSIRGGACSRTESGFSHGQR